MNACSGTCSAIEGTLVTEHAKPGDLLEIEMKSSEIQTEHSSLLNVRGKSLRNIRPRPGLPRDGAYYYPCEITRSQCFDPTEKIQEKISRIDSSRSWLQSLLDTKRSNRYLHGGRCSQ